MVKKKKRDPLLCQVCGHNMGRSRCRVIDGEYGVRCNKCKTVYTITIKLPKAICDVIQPLTTHSQEPKVEGHGEAKQSG